jgi:3-oxoadipate enol-lactonase
MESLVSDDARIFYDLAGTGPPVVLLHPFPAHHEFWLPLAQFLSPRYQLIMPDLRGHGESGLGTGPATMEKHAQDLARVLEETRVRRAVWFGVSIGGYILFEVWRRFRDRVSALVFANSKAGPDTEEARAARLDSARAVLERGTEPFFDSMLPKLLGETTRRARPDLVEGALRMMRKMSAEDVAGVQHGMAARPNSIPTLKTITVPTMVITGQEDVLTGVGEAQLMERDIAGSRLRVVDRAGHYSAWERPEDVAALLRQFLHSLESS